MASGFKIPILFSCHSTKTCSKQAFLENFFYRIGSWCCEGLNGQDDSLDMLLFNQGEPLDVLLLQGTKKSVPVIGNTHKLVIDQPSISADGYLHVESAAPKYDMEAGVAIYWKESVR